MGCSVPATVLRPFDFGFTAPKKRFRESIGVVLRHPDSKDPNGYAIWLRKNYATSNMCSTSRTVKSALLERVIQTKLCFRFDNERKTAFKEAKSVGTTL